MHIEPPLERSPLQSQPAFFAGVVFDGGCRVTLSLLTITLVVVWFLLARPHTYSVGLVQSFLPCILKLLDFPSRASHCDESPQLGLGSTMPSWEGQLPYPLSCHNSGGITAECAMHRVRHGDKQQQTDGDRNVSPALSSSLRAVAPSCVQFLLGHLH